MQTWQLQEAKAHLSEVVRLCLTHGPQLVTVRGREEAVLMSKAEYDMLLGKKPSFVTFMQNSPLNGIELDIERDRSSNREIEL